MYNASETNPVLTFISKRFKDDCSWLTGNCYYFATILKDRFPQGEIYYDVINGHFVFKYGLHFYDWSGIVKPSHNTYKWSTFKVDYDPLVAERVISGCIE